MAILQWFIIQRGKIRTTESDKKKIMSIGQTVKYTTFKNKTKRKKKKNYIHFK